MTAPNSTQYSGMPLLHAHLEGFLANTFASAYWKDIEGKYLGTNDVFIDVSGVQQHDNVVGTTDNDQIWHEQAPLMMQNDNEVVTTGCIKTTIEKALHPKGHVVHYLSHKTPLRNRFGNIIGTFGLSYGFETQSWNKDRLNEVAVIVGTHGVEHVKRFLLKQQSQTYKLSKRQTDCLYYVTKGMTTKQTAKVLSLSNRTVEHYLEAVKEKLGCSSKDELIAKASEFII